MRELENYKEINKFNATHFEKDLIAASRIKYDDPAGLRSKLIYTESEFAGGYEVKHEYVHDPTNKGLQLRPHH